MWTNLLKLFVLFLLVPAGVRAEGSVSYFSDLLPLLKARPDLAESIANLKMNQFGQARRIGHLVSPRLAGLRVGPYIFQAETPSHRILELTFKTDVDFFDDSGVVVAQIRDGVWTEESGFAKAVIFQERISSIEIRSGIPSNRNESP